MEAPGMKNPFRSLSLSASGAGWATPAHRDGERHPGIGVPGPGQLVCPGAVQAGEQARADQAANGVPVIQSTGPTRAAYRTTASRTTTSGARQILNNSASTVQTQLGGYIQGNGNLQPGQSARLISMR
jgi:filamentous hemagglutinin